MTKRFKSFTLGTAALALAFLAAKPIINPSPILMWNASESVPVGWYFVAKRQPVIGEIAVIRPAEWVRNYAATRRYLPQEVLLLKPIFAAQTINHLPLRPYVFVDGKHVAKAQIIDKVSSTHAGLEGLQDTQTFAVFCPWPASWFLR